MHAHQRNIICSKYMNIQDSWTRRTCNNLWARSISGIFLFRLKDFYVEKY